MYTKIIGRLILLVVMLFGQALAPNVMAAFNCKNEFRDKNYSLVYAESSCFVNCAGYSEGDNNLNYCSVLNASSLPQQCESYYGNPDDAYGIKDDCLNLCQSSYYYSDTSDYNFCSALAGKCEGDGSSSRSSACDSLCGITYYQTGESAGYTFCGSDVGDGGGSGLISSNPLFLGTYSDPNIMLTIDDSDSMTYEVMPKTDNAESATHLLSYASPTLDDTYESSGITVIPVVPTGTAGSPSPAYKQSRSYAKNKLYYNPAVSYKPWTSKTGSVFVKGANESITESRGSALDYFDDNGNVKKSCTGTGCTATASWCAPLNPAKLGAGCVELGIGAAIESHYYTYDSDLDTYTEQPLSTDADMQNFANWFTYYRSKILSTRAAIGHTFGRTAYVPESYRVGFATVHTTGTTRINETPDSGPSFSYGSDVLQSGVESFSDAQDSYRDKFFSNLLYKVFVGGSTKPLINAVDKVGDYFDGAAASDTYSIYGPWSDDPGGDENDTSATTVGTALADAKYCRRSFNVLITDGEWTDTAADRGLSTKAESYYTPGVETNTTDNDNEGLIVDLGGEYLSMGQIDINFDNDFTDYGDNKASFSHLTQMTVAFGVVGTEAIPSVGQTLSLSNTADKIDDLYYAAVKTGGRYHQADDSTELSDAIRDIANAIGSSGRVNTELSGSAVALNSGSLYEGSILYQALFKSKTWSGRVVAYNIQLDGSLDLVNTIESNIAYDSARNIATYGCTSSNSTTTCSGVNFDSDASTTGKFMPSSAGTLGVAISSNSDADNVIDWLRGDSETDLSAYRSREVFDDDSVNLLGDIINAAPIFYGESRGLFSKSTMKEGEVYDDFVQSQNCTTGEGGDCPTGVTPITRDDLVFVGANDGMMHMFKAIYDGDGDLDELNEIAAYVPNKVIAAGKLDDLAAKSTHFPEGYTHYYYVDSTPTVGDVYIDSDISSYESSSWKSLLVGGLGGGGKGIYAIDVTDSSVLGGDSADLPSAIMWEFPLTTDDNMGYSFSRPNLVRLPSGDGDWAVAVGNGYDSVNGDACLYLLDVADGSILESQCVGAYPDSDTYPPPSGVTTANGMSTVTPVDVNGDYVADIIYGGDLYGNVWRFDLREYELDEDGVVISAGDYIDGSAQLIFTAEGPLGQVQPITTRISVGRHPSGIFGYMLYFGTGKYLGEVDTDPSVVNNVHTFYGIWDRNIDEADYADPVSVADLLEQQILFERDIDTDDGDTFSYRISTDYDITWFEAPGDGGPFYPSTRKGGDGPIPDTCYSSDASYDPEGEDCSFLGWKMDLFSQETPSNKLGEMQVTDSILLNGKIIFTTTIPDTSVCGSNDYGWLMELDASDGSRLSNTPFDVNGDGVFTSDDLVAYDEDGNEITISAENPGLPVTGRKSTVGLLPTPGILSDYSDPMAGKEFKYMSGSTGEIEAIKENAAGESNNPSGRQTWIQLYR